MPLVPIFQSTKREKKEEIKERTPEEQKKLILGGFNDFFSNQQDAAIEIIDKVAKGAKWIVLQAQTQVGKTKAVGCYLRSTGKPVCLITGISDTDMVDQLYKDLQYIKNLEILHNPSLQSFIKNGNSDKYNNHIVVIDESHYGQNAFSSVDTFLKKIGILPSGIIENKNIPLVISVSATPMSEVSKENIEKGYKQIVILRPGDGYKSMRMMMNENKILRGYNLKEEKGCELFIDDLYEKKVLSENKYIIIRNNFKTDDAKEVVINNIKSIMGMQKYISIKYCICYSNSGVDTDSENKKKKIDDYLEKEIPLQPTFLIIYNYLRLGKQTDTTYISAMHDTPKAKTDTSAQSLAGRACGYKKIDHNVYIYTCLTAIKDYIYWVESDFSKNKVPVATNVVPIAKKFINKNDICEQPRTETTGDEMFNDAKARIKLYIDDVDGDDYDDGNGEDVYVI